jgi:nitrogen regulatory protein P-II 1
MTKLEAIVRPSTLDEVRRALDHAWITGITVSEVKGHGRQEGHTELYRGVEYQIDTNPKLKIEIVVPDPLVPRILHDLEQALRTGSIGDGKVFVVRIDEAVRVRTGERGEDAL